MEQSYSPAPDWLDGHLPQRNGAGGLELVYKSPATASLDLDLAANQLTSTLTMFTKEQVAGHIESTLLGGQSERQSSGQGSSGPMAPLDRARLSQTIAQQVARSIDAGKFQIDDYFYRKTRLGNEAPKTTLYALITLPPPAYRGIVAAITQTLRRSPSSNLRALARSTPGRF